MTTTIEVLSVCVYRTDYLVLRKYTFSVLLSHVIAAGPLYKDIKKSSGSVA